MDALQQFTCSAVSAAASLPRGAQCVHCVCVNYVCVGAWVSSYV